MTKCLNANCRVCPYVKVGKEVICSVTGEKYVINSQCYCHTTGCVYCLSCVKPGCGEQYIGQSGREMRTRWGEHLDYIRDNVRSTGTHFNLPGHNLSHVSFTVLETVYTNSRLYREARERYYIDLFQTKYRGMNTQ